MLIGAVSAYIAVVKTDSYVRHIGCFGNRFALWRIECLRNCDSSCQSIVSGLAMVIVGTGMSVLSQGLCRRRFSHFFQKNSVRLLSKTFS